MDLDSKSIYDVLYIIHMCLDGKIVRQSCFYNVHTFIYAFYVIMSKVHIDKTCTLFLHKII